MRLAEVLEHRVMEISICADRKSLGFQAALGTSLLLRELLKEKDLVNIVFAAAPSQNEFLEALVKFKDIDWSCVNAFHLDEYVGLSADHPQRFSKFLKDRIFDLLPFRNIYYVVPPGCEQDDPHGLAERYEQILRNNKLHIACIGIGENGHIAFNEPFQAKFDDDKLVRVVKLDERSRQQQVNDGCFQKIEDVPTHAITLTVPAIMSAEHIICVVPGKRKAEAVFKTLEGPISIECPASVMRRHKSVRIFLDKESASLLGRCSV